MSRSGTSVTLHTTRIGRLRHLALCPALGVALLTGCASAPDSPTMVATRLLPDVTAAPLPALPDLQPLPDGGLQVAAPV